MISYFIVLETAQHFILIDRILIILRHIRIFN